jgi:5-methylcytosine-specific restriction protein A
MASAVEAFEPPADLVSLTDALQARDVFEAKLALGIAAIDRAGLWDLDHATSGVAWLRQHGRMSGGPAKALLNAGRRASDVPALAEAWVDGRLSTAQVQAIIANVSAKTAELFAEHAPDLVPRLVPLSVLDTATAMQRWRANAEALLGEKEPPSPERSLFASRTFVGQLELKGSFVSDDASVVEQALKVAVTEDDEATGVRSPCERRADALADVCRFFLDHQDSTADLGRHRPHLNVIVDLDDVVGDAAGGCTVDGGLLDPDAIRVLLCDSNVHRVVTDGKGSILDYGRSTRTAPPALFTALVLRDGHCRLVEGCDRGPQWCDAHHVVPWEDGGETSIENMVLACSRHHHLLHRQHWRQRLADDGALTINTTDGRTWTTVPGGAAQARLRFAS